MRERVTEPFCWRPRHGPDAAALSRLRAHSPRPQAPLEDAWFLAGAPAPVAAVDRWMSYWEVRDALYDLSRNAAHGAARPLARDWFHFLLAQEIPGAQFGSVLSPLVEALATSFFILYPLGTEDEPYDGFFRDCLLTLGRVVMGRDGWSPSGALIRGAVLRRRWRLGAGWGWERPAGDLSASMFFCLKYLPPAKIDPWLRSALEIEDSCWRAQLVAWFVSARGVLDGTIRQPADLPHDDERPLFWTDSNLISVDVIDGDGAPFLPVARRLAARAALAAYFDDISFTDWAGGVLGDGELAAALGELPWRFRELFVRAPA
ncbi:MAG: hypothetical protein ACR652_17055 [Methylocystis sp.]|uniref:hypothetical protein n=1 Tax=Methylocystis sp. TaxID=1911079 RepID=UPI003DA65707